MKYEIDSADRSKGYRVYYNLRLLEYSVQAYFPGVGWRLVRHTDNIVLQGVRQKVYRSGLDKVRETGVKNVHAYLLAVGLVETSEAKQSRLDALTGHLFYNPYEVDRFKLVINGKWNDWGWLDAVHLTIANGRPVIKAPIYYSW